MTCVHEGLVYTLEYNWYRPDGEGTLEIIELTSIRRDGRDVSAALPKHIQFRMASSSPIPRDQPHRGARHPSNGISPRITFSKTTAGRP